MQQIAPSASAEPQFYFSLQRTLLWWSFRANFGKILSLLLSAHLFLHFSGTSQLLLLQNSTSWQTQSSNIQSTQKSQSWRFTCNGILAALQLKTIKIRNIKNTVFISGVTQIIVLCGMSLTQNRNLKDDDAFGSVGGA